MSIFRQAIRGLFLLICLLLLEVGVQAFGCSGVQVTAQPSPAAPAVVTGLDTLIQEEFAPLRGKRVGLITNQTGVTGRGRSNIDALFQASQRPTAPESQKGRTGQTAGFRMVALFSPEHGLSGRAAAGASVDGGRDRATGLPIYSLYGVTRKPTKAMLRNIDALVFDIQDIGARSYTYVSTLGLCMEAAAQNKIAFVVLDRPNPVGGNRVEGNPPAPGFRSFVGKYPVAYLHGMTVGELAQMLNGEGFLAGGAKCRLQVIAMQGWRRDMTWEETGLPWIPTSPHVPFARTAFYYAATGQAGELSALSIGIGTAQPFEYAGAPNLDGSAYVRELTRRNLPGVRFTPAVWTPNHGVYKGRRCSGAHIEFTDVASCELCRLNFELMDAARRVQPTLAFFTDAETTRMFDLVNGTDEPRKRFAQGQSVAQIWTEWNKAASAFRVRRRPYLLYPEKEQSRE